MSAVKKRKLASERTADKPDVSIKRKKRTATREPSPSDSESEEDFATEPELESAEVAGENDAEETAEEAAPAPKSFAELGIIDSLCEACDALGYKAPTPIQAQSIPLALQGRDMIGLA